MIIKKHPLLITHCSTDTPEKYNVFGKSYVQMIAESRHCGLCNQIKKQVVMRFFPKCRLPSLLSVLMDDLTLHVDDSLTDSQNFVRFVCQIDGYGLRDYVEHLQPPDHSFNMYAHICKFSCASDIFIRQLPSFLSERQHNKTHLSLQEQISDGEASVCHHCISRTKIFQETRLLC